MKKITPRVEDLTVEAIMSKNLAITSLSSSILDVAKIMKDNDVNSVIVIDGSKPIGIITERDIVVKALASGIDVNCSVSTIMSKSLIIINPSIRIVDAARIMVKNDIRRLIVVNGGSIVGIVTEKDILKVTPEIIDILIESVKVNYNFETEFQSGGIAGYCDNCSEWSDDLIEINGEYLCSECKIFKGV